MTIDSNTSRRREELVARARDFGLRQEKLQRELATVSEALTTVLAQIEEIDAAATDPNQKPSRWSPQAAEVQAHLSSGMGFR